VTRAQAYLGPQVPPLEALRHCSSVRKTHRQVKRRWQTSVPGDCRHVPVFIRRLIGYTLTEPSIRRIACPESTSSCNCPVAAAWAMTNMGHSTVRQSSIFTARPAQDWDGTLLVNERPETRLNVRVIAPDRPGFGHSDLNFSQLKSVTVNDHIAALAAEACEVSVRAELLVTTTMPVSVTW